MKFWKSKKRIRALVKKMDKAEPQDRHRVHAHGVIDAMLEDGDITWKKAQKEKAAWDKRHGK